MKKLNEGKAITLNNVEKFVADINDYACEHFDKEDLDFVRKYGKFYDFRIREDGTQYVVYDAQGTFDVFDDESSMRKYVEKLAGKYGWYIEAVSSSCDFTFGEL